MEGLLESLGLTNTEMTTVIVVAIVALVALFLFRAVFKLTAALFRLGCVGVLVLVVAVLLVNVLR